MNIIKYFKTEEEFYDNCWMFANKLFDFVESISGDNRWWFDVCYKPDNKEEKYSVIFKSYVTPEFRNFVLSIYVEKVGNEYDFKVMKQVTELA